MNDVMDRIWEFIEAFLNHTVVSLDTTMAPLEILGPGVVIFVLAFIVVVFTRIVARFYVTQRSVKLEKDFIYWKGIREEAMKHPIREKGKALAKNVDQAQLNRAYYDYFFEGLLKHFIVNVLPILLMVSYVTKVYTPQTLLQRFGERWIFSFSFGSSNQVNVSSMLWLVICFILSFILVAVLKMVFKKRYAQKNLSNLKLILQSLQAMVAAGLILMPLDAYAIQLHTSSEGIITHQIGHLFFLFSMVVLIFTISKKGLASQKGWRLIQYSAFLFILWNIGVITAHFLDNQIHVVTMDNISLGQIRVNALNGSEILAWVYYVLKLDHLFCVPAMVFFFQGLSNLVDEQRQMMAKKEGP